MLASGLVALAGACAAASTASVRRAVLDRRLGVGRTTMVRATVPRAALGIAVALVVTVLLLGPGAGLTSAAAVLGGRLVLRRRRTARAEELRAEQLPGAAAALAAGLRAGLSLAQAIAYARDEASPPLREDLSLLVSAVELGTPVGDALGDWAEVVGSEDARLVAAVVDLHRRSGGDLPTVLDGVVSALRERRGALREVRALTAQARLSGVILGALPIGFFAFLLLTARHEMLAAIATPLGRVAILVGLGLELAAFAWIRRLLAVR